MYDNLEQMSIVERDKIIKKLNTKIGELKGRQKQKKESIKEKEKDNRLLRNIARKYDYQIQLVYKMKERQIKQIHDLLGYLDKSMKTTEMSNSKLEAVNTEHKHLIKELTQINHELNQMRRDMKQIDEEE